MSGPRRAWLAAGSLLVSLALCAAAIGPTLDAIGLAALGRALLRVAPLALAIVGAEVACRAQRLVAMTSAIGHALPLATALRITLAGDFAAALTPAGAGGEPARLWALARAGLPWSRAALVLALELAVDLLSLCGLVAALAVSGGLPSTHAWPAPVPAFAMAAGAAVSVPVLRRLPRARQRLRTALNELRLAVRVAYGRKLKLLVGLIAGASHQVLRFSLLPLIAAGLGIHVDLRALVLWQLLAFYGIALLPTPGGTGGVEVGFLLFFGSLVPSGQLGPLLLVWRLFTYQIYVLLGWAALAGRRPRAAMA